MLMARSGHASVRSLAKYTGQRRCPLFGSTKPRACPLVRLSGCLSETSRFHRASSPLRSKFCGAFDPSVCAQGPKTYRLGCSFFKHLPGSKEAVRNHKIIGRLTSIRCDGSLLVQSSRGARRGASEQRFRVTAAHVQRLKCLVEPHPATSRNNKYLNGMQEVWGSNPLSSTFSQLRGMFRS
jgi:hypothetical protein